MMRPVVERKALGSAGEGEKREVLLVRGGSRWLRVW